MNAIYTHIINAQTLNRHLNASTLVILDCRFQLGDANWGYKQFTHAHIPGANHVALEWELSKQPINPSHGRHPLPEVEQLNALFSKLGIDSDSQVVVYDQKDGSIAARAWWCLRYLGHRAVAVLDGGFAAWQTLGYPQASETKTSSTSKNRSPSEFKGMTDNGMTVIREQIDKVPLLLDARAYERYSGQVEPIDPIAGHIPGAVSFPYSQNLDDTGKFLSQQQVEQNFLALFKKYQTAEFVVYCGSGVTACHLLLAAEYANVEGGLLYPGSYSQWCNSEGCRIETHNKTSKQN